jgi:hypothetical protein
MAAQVIFHWVHQLSVFLCKIRYLKVMPKRIYKFNHSYDHLFLYTCQLKICYHRKCDKLHICEGGHPYCCATLFAIIGQQEQLLSVAYATLLIHCSMWFACYHHCTFMLLTVSRHCFSCSDGSSHCSKMKFHCLVSCLPGEL